MTVSDLSKQLKVGTKKSHSAAENTKFVSSFLRGVVSEDNYKKLVSDFYFVYRAMEEEFRKYKDDPILGPLYFQQLEREESLAQDCRYFYGPTWRRDITPGEGAQKYVNRIRECALNEPYLLVGHHYTRYLGDLSGGQILKGIAEKSMKLRNGDGLHFYEFENISDAKEFKVKYRSTLDTLPLDQSQANSIIEEANHAFKLNMYMFDELKGNWLASVIKLLLSFVTK